MTTHPTTTTLMKGALADISKAVGNTPIVRLSRVTATPQRIGGSTKAA